MSYATVFLHSSIRLGIVSALGAAAISLGGCASHPPVVAEAPTHVVIAGGLTLRGVAEPTLSNASCAAATPVKASQMFELQDSALASIILQPQDGEGPLPTTMLHVTHVESNQTWCVMTRDDGSPALVGGELPMGTYRVAVAGMRGAQPRRYEVRIEKL